MSHLSLIMCVIGVETAVFIATGIKTYPLLEIWVIYRIKCMHSHKSALVLDTDIAESCI